MNGRIWYLCVVNILNNTIRKIIFMKTSLSAKMGRFLFLPSPSKKHIAR